MKRFKTLVIIGLLLSFISCDVLEDELEENPKSDLSTDFLESEAGLQTLVNSTHEPIRSQFRSLYFLLNEIQADYSFGRGSTQPIGSFKGLDVTNQLRTATQWEVFYQSIRNANLAIESVSESEIIDESQKRAWVAEARFMRAFHYYHLVRHFGPVPLYLDFEEQERGERGRDPVEDVFNAIIADLEVGEQDLPSTPSQMGRPTKWAAKALLAEVYLTIEEWGPAKEKAKEVMDSGEFGLVQVSEVGDFENLYGAEVNGSIEEIFYIKWNRDDGWGWPLNLLWEDTIYSPFGNFVIFERPGPFFDNWDNDDLRKEWSIFTEFESRTTGEIEQLPSTTPILTRKFRDPAASCRTCHANDYPFLRYADVLLIFAEASNEFENGPSQLAVESLNQVRRRAYGFPSDSPSSVDFDKNDFTVDSFRDTVIQERAFEFYMEGSRWFDLIRTGMVEEKVLENLGIVVEEIALLWPIPQQEIDTNPGISQSDQNPGY